MSPAKKLFYNLTQQRQKLRFSSLQFLALMFHKVINVYTMFSVTFQDYTLNMYIRQRWTDRRLANDKFAEPNGILINDKIEETWLPDLFIKNDKVSKKSDITSLNAFLRVNEDGKLVYSMRVTSTIACAMHLSRYPFDVQKCNMLFESCEYIYLLVRVHIIILSHYIYRSKTYYILK